VSRAAHLAVAILEAQLLHGAWWQGHVLEGLGPEAALEGNVVDAEGNLGVLELAAGLVHILGVSRTAGATVGVQEEDKHTSGVHHPPTQWNTDSCRPGGGD